VTLPLGSLLYGLDPAHGAVVAAGLGPDGSFYLADAFTHDQCNISAFCRNPLHPGPCKGWKKKLGIEAPGISKILNEAHQKKVAAKRVKVAAAKGEAEKLVTAKGHVHPLLHKKAVVKSTNVILGDTEEKAGGKASKTILNKTEIKRYSKIKGAQIGDAAASRGLTSDSAKYSSYAEGKISEALAKDNQEGGHSNFAGALASMGDALASSFADKNCGVGNPDGDCDGTTHEALKQGVVSSVTEGLITGDWSKFDKLAADLKGAKSQEELHAKLGKQGVDVEAIDAELNPSEDEEGQFEPVKAPGPVKPAVPPPAPKPPAPVEPKPKSSTSISATQQKAVNYATGKKAASAKAKLELYQKLGNENGFKDLDPGSQQAILDDLDDMAKKFLDSQKKGDTKALKSQFMGDMKKGAAPAPAAADLIPDKEMTDNQKVLMAQLGTSVSAAAKKAAVKKTVDKMGPEEFDSLPDDVKKMANDVMGGGSAPGSFPHKAVAQALENTDLTSMQKVAKVGQLTPEEFETLPADVKAKASDLVTKNANLGIKDAEDVADKFGLPKKYAIPDDVATALGGPKGTGGAGAGGGVNTTAPDASLGSTGTNAAKAKQGADSMAEMSKLVGNTPTDAQIEATAKVIEKIMDNGKEPELEGFAQGIAGQITSSFVQAYPGVPSGAIKDVHAAVTKEAFNKLSANGKPTPILDAIDKWAKGGKGGGPAADHVFDSMLKAMAEQHEESVLAQKKSVGSMISPVATQAIADKLGIGYVTDEMDLGNPTKVDVNAKILAEEAWDAKIYAGLGVADDFADNLKSEPWAQAAIDQMAADFAKTIHSGNAELGEFHGKLDKAIKVVADKGNDLATQKGWSPISDAVQGWKSAVLLAELDHVLHGKSVGSAAGTGGPAMAENPAKAEIAKETAKVAQAAPNAYTQTSGKVDFTGAHNSAIYKAYKNQPGTQISSPEQDNYNAVLAVATAFTGTPGFGDVSLTQVLDALDTQSATNLGVPNSNKLKKKIEAWLATPEGAAYAQSAAPAPHLIAHLTGMATLPTGELPKLGHSGKVAKLSGPGEVTKADSAFHKYKGPSSVVERKKYYQANGKFLTTAHKNAIESYTGAGYLSMNNYLRGKDGGDPHTIQQAQLVQDAMMPLQRDHELIRGAGWSVIPEAYRSLEGLQLIKGKVLQDDAFMSTTVGGESLPGIGATRPLRLHIQAPKGTQALYIDDLSANKGEKEMLLAAGTQLKIMDAYADAKGQIHINLRVVNPK
jgi:hypothetical protein